MSKAFRAIAPSSVAFYHVYHGRGHGHVYHQGTFTVEVWIFLEEMK